IFARQAPDILWGMARCLARLGALPETVVWDREAAIAPRGRPTDSFAAFCGALPVGWSICEAADPESKGLLERSHRYLRSNFEPGRSFASPGHFQAELDEWFEKADRRLHRGIRAVPAERLEKERERMRPLPDRMPETDRRFVTRVPQQPTCASTPTTTRSTPGRRGCGSRCGPPRARSSRSSWARAPWSPPTDAPSPST
ncbi:MAG: DDE-type integrase/transposase/recombinase, partial [Actinobacteria bacterium]|nr:DDE-type integrase/transposase/recombinase [Actinomycetota bacterium]